MDSCAPYLACSLMDGGHAVVRQWVPKDLYSCASASEMPPCYFLSISDLHPLFPSFFEYNLVLFHYRSCQRTSGSYPTFSQSVFLYFPLLPPLFIYVCNYFISHRMIVHKKNYSDSSLIHFAHVIELAHHTRQLHTKQNSPFAHQITSLTNRIKTILQHTDKSFCFFYKQHSECSHI